MIVRGSNNGMLWCMAVVVAWWVLFTSLTKAGRDYMGNKAVKHKAAILHEMERAQLAEINKLRLKARDEYVQPATDGAADVCEYEVAEGDTLKVPVDLTTEVIKELYGQFNFLNAEGELFCVLEGPARMIKLSGAAAKRYGISNHLTQQIAQRPNWINDRMGILPAEYVK